MGVGTVTMKSLTSLITNSAKCLNCGDVLISVRDGQMIDCKCGNLSIDGGKEFRHRRYKKNLDSWEDLSTFEE